MAYTAELNFIITLTISILTIIISLLLLHQVTHGIVKCNNKYAYYTYININIV